MSNDNQDGDALLGIDILGLLRNYGRKLLLWALGVAAGVGLVAIVYMVWLQPVRHTYVLEFRPTFQGASEGEYPNGLPFSYTDITAVPISNLVYDRNAVQDYCSRNDFRGGLFVEQYSAQSMFLDTEYETRLADPRLTTIDRQQLQEEYQAKRDALPIGSRLVFVRSPECETMPELLVTKVMTEILQTWADESEAKRGVLSLQVQILTPAMLDTAELAKGGSSLLRADIIRLALLNIIANVGTVQDLQGAGLIRLADGSTLLEVRNKLRDLVKFRLEPLVATAGRSMAAESSEWVREMLAVAERDADSASGQAQAYRAALREYSGLPQSGGGQSARLTGQSPTGSSEVQSLTPIIDRSFIDRIVEMSEVNAQFRQQLTTEMVKAEVDAVAARDRAAYYARLLQSFRQPSGAVLSAKTVEEMLDEIVAQGKALTTQYNDLYREFSRVALRTGGAIYAVEKPVSRQITRSFTLVNAVVMVLIAFLIVLLGGFVVVALRDRLQAVSN